MILTSLVGLVMGSKLSFFVVNVVRVVIVEKVMVVEKLGR